MSRSRFALALILATAMIPVSTNAIADEITEAFLSNTSDQVRATTDLAAYMLETGIEGCFIAPGRAQGTPATFSPFQDAISGYEVAATWGHCPPDEGPITVEIEIEYHLPGPRWEEDQRHRCTLPVLPHSKPCIYERFVSAGTYEDQHPRVGRCRRARFSIVERPDVPAQYSGIFACALVKV